jgi:hypothetical protein
VPVRLSRLVRSLQFGSEFERGTQQECERLHRFDILLRRVGCTEVDRDTRFPDVFGPHRSERLRKVDGWQTLATKPVDQPIDLAA